MPGKVRNDLGDRFEHGIRPLHEAGKLTCVHFQFPPWVVTPNPRTFAHIEECAGRLPGYQLATAFRQQAWFDDTHRDATVAFERQHDFAHVVVGARQGFKNSVPQVWEVAIPKLVIVRLHGRSTATSDRCSYDYRDAELAELVGRIHQLADQAQLVQTVFNNNYEDQGQRNTKTLQKLLAA